MRSSNLFDDESLRRQAWDGIEALVREAHDNAVEHGFYADIFEVQEVLTAQDRPEHVQAVTRDFTLAQIAKIAGEAGEAVGAIQKGETEKFREELADIVIRVLDLAGFCFSPLDFAYALLNKMQYNRTRPYKHAKLC